MKATKSKPTLIYNALELVPFIQSGAQSNSSELRVVQSCYKCGSARTASAGTTPLSGRCAGM